MSKLRYVERRKYETKNGTEVEETLLLERYENIIPLVGFTLKHQGMRYTIVAGEIEPTGYETITTVYVVKIS